jgi:hypothetical protein
VLDNIVFQGCFRVVGPPPRAVASIFEHSRYGGRRIPRLDPDVPFSGLELDVLNQCPLQPILRSHHVVKGVNRAFNGDFAPSLNGLAWTVGRDPSLLAWANVKSAVEPHSHVHMPEMIPTEELRSARLVKQLLESASFLLSPFKQHSRRHCHRLRARCGHKVIETSANRSLPDHGSRVRGKYKIDMDGFGVYQESRNDVA